ncbi:PEP-CTERM sorting domain-containing protein [Aphanothece sacrum]|uniref:Quinoprotein n=1 Tax=Aphanothece sacrum FPU1 TaxID=1920663 RepID=A0A401IGF4_APHSA|nr:PEP-CTERM sorting domain-containing protein [Aphanothece sacrum]GBF80270.1 quinoprotein [Aphanothece sacrum FPU1]GBF83675.1 quinoprotein [Aphanothece sacrum FPU3]
MKILNPPKFVSRSLIGAVGLSAITLIPVKAQAAGGPFNAGPTDDVTQSLGSFQIVVNRKWRHLFVGQPASLYNKKTFTLTSPILFDSNTVIGRSNPHIDGDAADTGGAIVGTAKRIISDSDFSIMPLEFKLPAAREVHTNVESLLLTGGGGFNVRVGSKAPNRPISPGEVQSNATGDDIGNTNFDFPAKSFFNVFAEVDIPGLGTLFNTKALFLRGDDNLMNFPPKVVYLHESSDPVRVYFKSCLPVIRRCTPGQAFGSLTLAGHGIGFNQDDFAEFDFRLTKSARIPVDPREMPEPLTILGSATAMGFGTFFKRKLGKKRQQDKA